MNGKRKKPSKEDRDLFERAMSDVRRIDLGVTEPAEGPLMPTVGKPRTRAPAKSLPTLTSGVAAGVDGRTVTRLKRGQIRPEDRLDLHGLALDQAHRAVSAFIERSAGRGLRCVVVITGKGKVGEVSGTIRTELPRWLNLPPTRGRILAIAQAQPRDGGAGASYILLRRAQRVRG